MAGQRLPYDTLDEVRRHLCQSAPHFARLDQAARASWGSFGQAGEVSGAPFAPAVADFYLHNPISRASATMAACSAEGLERVKKHG
jgi:NADH-quinone oxidoreductase subunit G